MGGCCGQIGEADIAQLMKELMMGSPVIKRLKAVTDVRALGIRAGDRFDWTEAMAERHGADFLERIGAAVPVAGGGRKKRGAASDADQAEDEAAALAEQAEGEASADDTAGDGDQADQAGDEAAALADTEA